MLTATGRGAVGWRLIAAVLAFAAGSLGERAQAQQVSATDPYAIDAVSMLVQLCVPAGGDPDRLRGLAAAHGMKELGPAMATSLLGDDFRGRLYAARTIHGPLVLASDDDGACQVVARSGTLSAARGALMVVLLNHGMEPVQLFAPKRAGTDGPLLFRAVLGAQRWLMAVVMTPDWSAPASPPQMFLRAIPEFVGAGKRSGDGR